MRSMVGLFSGIVTLFGVGCADPGSLSDEAKRERIAELYAGYQESFVGVPGISAEELSQRLESAEGPILVDVRTPEERAISMIPGAISRETFEGRREEFVGRTVVTYCTIGYRSGLYAAELRAGGWQASNLEGSILSWTHAGGELVSAGEATRRLHVYGRTWDLAADGYETVW